MRVLAHGSSVASMMGFIYALLKDQDRPPEQRNVSKAEYAFVVFIAPLCMAFIVLMGISLDRNWPTQRLVVYTIAFGGFVAALCDYVQFELEAEHSRLRWPLRLMSAEGWGRTSKIAALLTCGVAVMQALLWPGA